MFESIDIQNFRGIESLKVEGLKRFNLIVGDNNSKKTTLLEAIFLLSSPAKSIAIGWINGSRGLIPESQHFFSALFYKAIYIDTIINISGQWLQTQIVLDSPPLKCNRIATIEQHSGTSETLTSSDSLFVQNEPQQLQIRLSEHQFSMMSNSIKTDKIEINPEILSEYYVLRDPENKKGLIRNKGSVALNEPLHIDCYLITEDLLNQTDFNSQIYEIARKRRVIPNILNSLTELSPKLELENIGLDFQKKLYCTLKSDTNDYPIEVMGDGFRKLFSFLTTAAASKDGVLLIDEIENGFYYQNLGLPWKHLFSAGFTDNVQLFATTHSKECIEAYLQQIEAGGYSFDDFNIIRMTHDHENKPVAIIFTGEELKENYDNNWEMRR